LARSEFTDSAIGENTMPEQQPMNDADLKEPVNTEDLRSKPAPLIPETPAANPTTAPSARTQIPEGVSLPTAIVVSALFAAFAGVLSWHFATAAHPSTPPVALVDASKIIAAESKLTLSTPGMTEDRASKAGQSFVLRLNQTLDEYTQAGVVVVNANVVLNNPSQFDITAQIAQKLGLKLE